MYKLITYSDELYHYGIKGMRWGVRRYQNYDGTRIGTGGAPVTNQAKVAGNSVALGQGGKATGNARFAAKREPLTKDQKKALADHLTSDSVKQGKGKDNISPIEDATKDVSKLTESGKKLTDLGKKHDPKVKKAGEKAKEEASKMSDQELREHINRIKMEREYKSLKESEVSSGWDKAIEFLDVAGDVLQIMGTLASLYLTYKIAKGKIGVGQSAISDIEDELKSFMESNEIDEEAIAHFMDLDDEYVETYLEHHGVKGMKWGVRRYQNPDGTRIGVGSGSGGGGGGHRADTNPVFKKQRQQKVIESFKKSVAGGQDGRAVGNERLAASVGSRSNKKSLFRNKKTEQETTILDKETSKDIVRPLIENDEGSERAELSNLAKKVQEASSKVDWDAQTKAENDAYADYRKKVYKETYDELKKNAPDELNKLIEANGGSNENLDKFHGFSKAMEGTSIAFPEPKVKGVEEFDRAFDEYYDACKKYANVLVKQHNDVALDQLDSSAVLEEVIDMTSKRR